MDTISLALCSAELVETKDTRDMPAVVYNYKGKITYKLFLFCFFYWCTGANKDSRSRATCGHILVGAVVLVLNLHT